MGRGRSDRAAPAAGTHQPGLHSLASGGAARSQKFLFGPALATTLLVGSLVEPTPAAAVDQDVIFVDIITFNEIEVLLNNSKRNTTLGAAINNLALIPFNSEADSNINGANVSNLNQLIDGTQRATSTNRIRITNNGEIDPAIGIFAQINNAGFDFFNSAALLNFNGDATVISLGDLNQTINMVQTNAVTNRITENNSAKVTAGLFGSFTEINNSLITQFFNFTAVSNINGDAAVVSVGNHLQLVDQDQTNTLSNTIGIDNSGEIDPDTGIFAGINNTLIASIFNSSDSSNVNGNLAVISVGDLIQTIESDQANTIANDIGIDNRAGIVADDIGIFAEINNSLIASLFNSVAASNINGDAAVVSLGDHDQSLDFDQANAITNGIGIENSAEIDADVGILATITNHDLASLFNSTATSNINGDAAVLTAGDLDQSIDQYQGNLIRNEITFSNSGDVMGGKAGLQAVIENLSIAQLRNSVTHSNLSGDAAVFGAGALIQTGDIDQANTLANDITIINSAKIMGQTGINAMIDNRDISFFNVIGFSNELLATTGVGDDLIQSTRIDQANIVTSTIGIWNTNYVKGGKVGIAAEIINEDISFINEATVTSTSAGPVNGNVTQTANVTQSNQITSKISVINTGRVWGGDLGIFASISDPDFFGGDAATVTLDAGTPSTSQSNEIMSSIVIDNAGHIGADSLFAIDTVGASTSIYNRSGGVITGFVDLTDKRDRFYNEPGGTFEARRTSDFGLGSDLFSNAGTVHTVENAHRNERTAFIGLERFGNSGLISLQDGRAGDQFTISNTVGATDLDFDASGNSTLAVDALLGPPGSIADNFIIEGNARGRTLLTVFNTNPGGGAFNPEGIPVVFVDGSVSRNAFYLDAPIEAGLFDYDLFFEPTGSGLFELRSHPGGGSHVLPRLITASHDIFYTTTETWLDRTADLRVLLSSGTQPLIGHNLKGAESGPVPTSFIPAVWVKGQGTWLNQEDKAKSTSFGRTYRFDLERDLDVMNFQTGIDLGMPDLIAPGDMLVFGMLGGAVFANLDYDNLARQFDIDGGEVGAYATYLRGGLFVDNLLKVHFLEIDPNKATGFPNSIDSTTWGFRTDVGYRFGSFLHGPFIEPLATIALAQNGLDDFTINGNSVDFGDETNVRGRLGLRVGTSYEASPGTLVEPFVIGSLWGNLSGDNQVTLTSTGRAFHFEDEPDDVWAVISGGVNVFNPEAQTSVFAKLDVTVGDETDGLSAKAGMRVNW